RSARAGSIKTRAHWRYLGLLRPEERMKCPSSKASAARNSARMSSSVIIAGRRLGLLAKPINICRKTRLRLHQAAPIEAPNQEARFHAFLPNAFVTGVTMRLIGWAIALAATGLTPAAAQTPPSAPSTAQA